MAFIAATTGYTAGSYFNVDIPAGTAVGDALILVAGRWSSLGDDSGYTTPPGWTQQGLISRIHLSGFLGFSQWTRVVDGTEAQISWLDSAAYRGAYICAYESDGIAPSWASGPGQDQGIDVSSPPMEITFGSVANPTSEKQILFYPWSTFTYYDRPTTVTLGDGLVSRVEIEPSAGSMRFGAADQEVGSGDFPAETTSWTWSGYEGGAHMHRLYRAGTLVSGSDHWAWAEEDLDSWAMA